MEVENSESSCHSKPQTENTEDLSTQTSDIGESINAFLDIKIHTSTSPIFEASFVTTTNKTLKYKCPICTKKFKSQETVQNHVNSHITVHSIYSDGNLKCSKCNFYFDDKNQLRSHSESHKKSRGRPRKNGSNEDEKLKPFICDKCAKSFKTKQQLSNHNLIHLDIKSYQCDLCEKSFKLKQQLKNHMKVHEDIRPFVCDICQKSFKFKQQLENHSKTHSDIRPFKCMLCDKAFKFKQQLQIHNRVHDDLRPFMCEFCDKTFKLKQQLQFHEKVHSDDRPFSCETCKKSFKFKQQLKTHYKKHTSDFIKNSLFQSNASSLSETLEIEKDEKICSSQEFSSKT